MSIVYYLSNKPNSRPERPHFFESDDMTSLLFTLCKM